MMCSSPRSGRASAIDVSRCHGLGPHFHHIVATPRWLVGINRRQTGRGHQIPIDLERRRLLPSSLSSTTAIRPPVRPPVPGT